MEKRQMMSLDSYILVLGYSDLIINFLTSKRNDGKVIVVLDNRITDDSYLNDTGFIVLRQNADDETTISSFNLLKASLIIIGSPDDGYNLLIAAALGQQKNQDSFRDNVIILVNKGKNMKKFTIFGYRTIDIPNTIVEYLDSHFKV